MLKRTITMFVTALLTIAIGGTLLAGEASGAQLSQHHNLKYEVQTGRFGLTAVSVKKWSSEKKAYVGGSHKGSIHVGKKGIVAHRPANSVWDRSDSRAIYVGKVDGYPVKTCLPWRNGVLLRWHVHVDGHRLHLHRAVGFTNHEKRVIQPGA